MKRKNNRNLFGVIALIAICAFMLISCPQQTSTLAKENPRELTLNYDGRSTIYYYLNNNWYSDKECKNVVEDHTLQPPAAQTATITVNFNEGTAQATGEEYFTSGANPFTWNFVKYVKAGDESKADYFGGELKLPENGISENVTLTAEYEQTEVVRKLPVLVKEGVTFGGYHRVNETVEADTPITVTPGLIATYNAIWTTYKTLTLEIDGQEQKLYYGSDSAWYKALSEGGLLIDDNKVTGDVKFNIPSAPTWTVTFDKNVPDRASESEFTITRESVVLKPELSLSPGDLIDNTGKVIPSSISENKTVTGTYPSKVIVESVIASSTNPNYEFAGWTANGVTIDNIATYPVSGNITIKATWKNLSSFKVLTVKDGVNEIDTAYYNTKDRKWYVSNDITSELKTSVPTLPNREYIITLNYDNDGINETRSEKVTSSFLGYGTNDNTSAVIEPNGLLSDYTIDKDTELVSLWSEVTIPEPSEQPTNDGYVFDSWYKDGQQYDFNSVVTGDMTLTANWTKKTFNTLTFDITGLSSPVATQTLYYGSDGAWYKALGNDDLLLTKNKVTGEDVKFNIPSAPTWTVSLNKNTPSSLSDDVITFSPSQLTLYPKDGEFSSDEYISKDGKVKVSSIAENVNVTLDTSRRYPSEIVEVTTPDGMKLVKWLNGAEEISDLSQYEVTSDNISLNASWGYKVSIGELKVPGVGISDADRGFYTTTQDIDESVKDKSKQQRVAYYTEGQTVKLYYCNDSIIGIEITLKNEWSGETKLIKKVGHHDYRYSLLEIAPMVNQPLSISFKVTKSEQV